MERKCQRLVWAYEDTGNPLYAWGALSAWSFAQHANSREGSARFDMPPALALFVLRMSAGMVNLSEGVPPLRYQDGQLVPNDADQPAPTPAETLALVPEALELSGEGWNAFAAYRTDQEARYLSDIYAEARDAGATYAEALEVVMREAGTRDERTARRRLKGGRKGTANTPPWRRNIAGAE